MTLKTVPKFLINKIVLKSVTFVKNVIKLATRHVPITILLPKEQEELNITTKLLVSCQEHEIKEKESFKQK